MTARLTRATGRPLPAVGEPSQLALGGFGVTYRERLDAEERARYERRRCAAGLGRGLVGAEGGAP